VSELSGQRILVVDDQPAMRATLAMLLRSLGADVQVAASGADAIERCAREPAFDAVLLDAYMPGLDGLALARLLHAAHPRTRLVLCTGAEEDTVRRALASGQVQSAVRKPFDVPSLVAALARR
jgi:CheY-like chemotaxis protein